MNFRTLPPSPASSKRRLYYGALLSGLVGLAGAVGCSDGDATNNSGAGSSTGAAAGTAGSGGANTGATNTGGTDSPGDGGSGAAEPMGGSGPGEPMGGAGPAEPMGGAGPGEPMGGAGPGEPGPECGGEGEDCCPNSVCDGGGCCVAGNCVANGEECSNNNACTDGACENCGTEGDACCQGSCGEGLACEDNVGPGSECVACGVAGMEDGDACCLGNFCSTGVCIGAGGFGGGTCQDECGAPDQACCEGQGGGCAAGATCNDQDMCVTCGGESEACCPPSAGNFDGCAGTLRCSDDTCIVCGEEGQDCCEGQGAACAMGNTCNAQNQCAACGDENEPCCRSANDQLFCNDEGPDLVCNNAIVCVPE